jgi:hypothetical protein
MSAHADIAALLEQWRLLSLSEGGAIRTAAWSRVAEIQAAKKMLRGQLAEASSTAPDQNLFRAQIARLISMEERNAEFLAAQMRRARAEQETIDQAGRNLRKIQRSYARKRMSVWQCVS